MYICVYIYVYVYIYIYIYITLPKLKHISVWILKIHDIRTWVAYHKL